MSTIELLRFYNAHPPGEVRLFQIPVTGIRRQDDHVLVYDVRVGEGVLRHYSFADRWFEVNCTLDLAGGFVTEPGHGLDWCFNCDISTPHAGSGTAVYNQDLWLDVLVAPDGRTHAVIDEEDFAEAALRGWATPAELEGARRGLADLLAIIQGPGLVAFLHGVFPFGPVADAPAGLPMRRLAPEQVPAFDKRQAFGAP